MHGGIWKTESGEGAPRDQWGKLEPRFMLKAASGWSGGNTEGGLNARANANAGRLDVFGVLHIAGLTKRRPPD